MAKKIKARKHALRKAVTATVLAGTAMQSLGVLSSDVEAKSKLDSLSAYNTFRRTGPDKRIRRDIVKKIVNDASDNLLEYYLKLNGKSNLNIVSPENAPIFKGVANEVAIERIKDFRKQKDMYKSLFENSRKYSKEIEKEKANVLEKFYDQEKQLKTTNNIIADKNREIVKRDLKIKELEDKEVKLNERLAKEKNRYRHVVRDAANLFIQRESIQKEADKYKNEAKVMTHALEQAKQEFDQKAKEAEVANNRVIVLSNALNQAKEEFDLKAAEAQKLNNNVTVLSNALQQAKEEFDKKAQEYQAALAEKDAIDGQLETALTKVSDLESQLASLKEANEAANQKITQLEQEVADGGVAFKDLKGQKEKSDAQVKAQADKIKELESDLEATQSELNQVKEQRANLEQEVAELGTKVKDLEKEKADLEKKAIDLEADKAELEAEMDRLKALLADKDLANDKLLKEMEDLQKDFDTKKNHSDREIADFQAEIARLQKELADQLAKMNIAHPQNQGLGKAMAASPMTDSHKASTDAKNNLPSTGDVMANPFFTASAMAIIIGADGLALNRKRKEA